MSPLNNALISYWRRLPAESPAARRRSLDALRERVRAGLEPHSALLPYAIGDVDDGIVVAATRCYVTADRIPAATPATHEAFVEASDWVRRGLALNRGAVFGALLALGNERACESLAPLRLALSAAEVEIACRVLGPVPGERATAFLREWLDLLGDGSLPRESRALQALLTVSRGPAWPPSPAGGSSRASSIRRVACGSRASRTRAGASAPAARTPGSR